jgi:hypothetical protein
MAAPKPDVWIIDDSPSQSETEQEDRTNAAITDTEGLSDLEDERPAIPRGPVSTRNVEVPAVEVHVEPQDVDTIMINEQVEASHIQVIVGLKVADNRTEMGGPKNVPTSDKPTLDEEQAKQDGLDNEATNPKVQLSSEMLISNEQDIGGGGAVATGPEIINGERILEQVDDEKRQIRNSNSTNVVVPMKKLSPNQLRHRVLDHLERVKPTRKYAIHEIGKICQTHTSLYTGLDLSGFPCQSIISTK